MRSDDFLEEHQAILHTIELNVVIYYREHPNLIDYNVEKIYNGIERTFQKEVQDKNPPKLRLNELEQHLFDKIEHMSRFFVGEAEIERANDENDENADEIDIDPVSKEVIVQCMKRLRGSIKTWTGKVHGKQGYLNYISRFM